ncbi:MAG TPA: hypothetical protein DCX52_17810 [Massilia sp.]|nr:hypothetical protein [Massilia sp.]
MPGTLFLIPNTLGPTDAQPGALNHVLPGQVQALTSQLGYFVAENAKTARAFLKLVAIDHPLARPLQEIRIAELNVNTPAAALSALLEPLLAGEDAGLVSEAGVPAAGIAASLGRLFEVDLVTFADAESFDWNTLPQDGRFTILASTSRRRYGDNARKNWRPDLHLALWNPYQALDFDAPALMTYGFAAPALDAVNAWLAGEIEAEGRCPVPGF